MVSARHGSLHVRLPIFTSFFRFILGIIIVLFFQCISALFSSTNRRGEAIKWGLVFYTVLMFTVVTAYTATYLGVPVTISHTINTESATVIQLKEGVQSHTHVVLKDYQ